MKNFSSRNTFSTSDGTRYTRTYIEGRIRRAKSMKIEMTLSNWGFVFCEICKINHNAGKYIDCSHTISVKECLESGRSELAWDVDNIRMLCRDCHRAHDLTF